jgi:Asp-tRNA(Asn)/Glu-tRNA(Gln) amidotransferase A subunit family amidase
VKAADYINAVAQMHNISREIIQVLAPYDALVTPTLTRPAVRLGTLPSNPNDALQELFGWLVFTFPFNATGQPAFSLPNGFSKEGLPKSGMLPKQTRFAPYESRRGVGGYQRALRVTVSPDTRGGIR